MSPLRIIPFHMEKYVDLEPLYDRSNSVCSICREKHLINHSLAYRDGVKCSICNGQKSKYGLFYSVPIMEIRMIKIDLIDV